MTAPAASKLENDVLSVLWKCSPCSVRQVQKQLTRPLAYTTVATLLERLYKKSLVSRQKTNSYLQYSPKITRANYSTNLIQSFFRQILNNFGDTAITSFADSIDKLPPNKRRQLLKLLEKKLK